MAIYTYECPECGKVEDNKMPIGDMDKLYVFCNCVNGNEHIQMMRKEVYSVTYFWKSGAKPS